MRKFNWFCGFEVITNINLLTVIFCRTMKIHLNRAQLFFFFIIHIHPDTYTHSHRYTTYTMVYARIRSQFYSFLDKNLFVYARFVRMSIIVFLIEMKLGKIVRKKRRENLWPNNEVENWMENSPVKLFNFIQSLRSSNAVKFDQNFNRLLSWIFGDSERAKKEKKAFVEWKWKT